MPSAGATDELTTSFAKKSPDLASCGEPSGWPPAIGARVRLVAEDAGRFAGADVQQVGQEIVRADRVDEITLQALRDQDRGRRRGDKKGTARPLNWPVAGIGRILSPRSIAEFDGE
jgi:hypothetical protein